MKEFHEVKRFYFFTRFTVIVSFFYPHYADLSFITCAHLESEILSKREFFIGCFVCCIFSIRISFCDTSNGQVNSLCLVRLYLFCFFTELSLSYRNSVTRHFLFLDTSDVSVTDFPLKACDVREAGGGQRGAPSSVAPEWCECTTQIRPRWHTPQIITGLPSCFEAVCKTTSWLGDEESPRSRSFSSVLPGLFQHCGHLFQALSLTLAVCGH